MVMEASAHAIALKQLLGVRSELAVFTNFSQDHLDFFGTMHSYAQAKESFFCEQYVKNALVNADDILGQSIAAKFPHTATYGIRCAADVTAKNVREGEGQTFEVEGFGQRAEVHTPLCGTFNVYNALERPACALNPDVARALEEARAFSPAACAVTGSGSAVFALFESEELCRWAKSRYRGKFRTRVAKTVQPHGRPWRSPFVLDPEEPGARP